MLFFVAALFAVMFASGAWCVLESFRSRKPERKAKSVAAVLFLGAVVVGVGAFLRFVFVPPHHAMYVDEPWYAEAACNLTRSGRLVLCDMSWSGENCVPYEKAPGWPVLQASWMWWRGCAASTGIDLNRVLGSATALLGMAAVRCAGGAWWQGLLAAAIIAIHPVHVAWSATGETNVSAAAALLAGLCGALLYIRSGRKSGAALAISALAAATTIRPECFASVVVSAVLTGIAARVSRPERLLVGAAIAATGAGALLAGLDLWAMNESISGGTFLAAGNIVQNLRALGLANSIPVHGTVFLIALVGAGMLVRAHENASALLLAGNVVAVAVAVLAYDRFDERMLLAPTVVAIPLGAFAFGPLPYSRRGRTLTPRVAAAGAFFVLVAFLWRDPLLSLSLPSSTQLLETRIASRAAATAFPPDALFIASQPTVLAAVGINPVMTVEEALHEKDNLERAIGAGKPVYFFCDMFCEKNFAGSTEAAPCGPFLRGFALSPVVQETLDARTYAVYRITGANDDTSEAPACPRGLPEP